MPSKHCVSLGSEKIMNLPRSEERMDPSSPCGQEEGQFQQGVWGWVAVPACTQLWEGSRLQLASRVRSMDSFTGAASIAHTLPEPGLEVMKV